MGATDAVDGEPQVGQTYVAENPAIGWCAASRAKMAGVDPCQLYQLLSDSEGNTVAEFSIFDLPEGQEAAAGATVGDAA